jgi:predicted ATPase
LKAEKQFQNAYKEPHEVVFIDRNSDVLAYMHYIGDSYPVFDSACREHTYSKIFILPPWEEIYISDHERYENFERQTNLQSPYRNLSRLVTNL